MNHYILLLASILVLLMSMIMMIMKYNYERKKSSMEYANRKLKKKIKSIENNLDKTITKYEFLLFNKEQEIEELQRDVKDLRWKLNQKWITKISI